MYLFSTVNSIQPYHVIVLSLVSPVWFVIFVNDMLR